jgi:hypothetical protein
MNIQQLISGKPLQQDDASAEGEEEGMGIFTQIFLYLVVIAIVIAIC